MKHLSLFAAGLLFGTAGIKLLTSKDAKKLYTHTTAAVLRAKDCVMETVTNVRENAEDIYAEAKAVNQQRAEEAAAAVVSEPPAAAVVVPALPEPLPPHAVRPNAMTTAIESASNLFFIAISLLPCL